MLFILLQLKGVFVHWVMVSTRLQKCKIKFISMTNEIKSVGWFEHFKWNCLPNVKSTHTAYIDALDYRNTRWLMTNDISLIK